MDKYQFADFLRKVMNLKEEENQEAPKEETPKETSSKITLHHGYSRPKDFDISTDEGIIGALQHINDVETMASAADFSGNVSRAERAAMEHNGKFRDQLTKLAKERKLKVKYSGIGGDYHVDYGTER